MERKVNLVGTSTLTVSLPSEFIKSQKIKKGDLLHSKISNGGIFFSKTKSKKEEKPFVLDTEKNTCFSILKRATYYYVNGGTKLELIHNKNTIFHERRGEISINRSNDEERSLLEMLLNVFLGSEVVSQTAKKTIIEFFPSDRLGDMDKISQRVYSLFKETLQEFMQAINGNFDDFYEMREETVENLNRFIKFYLRLLNQSDLSPIEKIYFSEKYEFIGKLADKVKHIAISINQYGSTKKVEKYLTEVFEIFVEILNPNTTADDFFKLSTKMHNYNYLIDRDKLTLKEFKVLAHLSWFFYSGSFFSQCLLIEKD